MSNNLDKNMSTDLTEAGVEAFTPLSSRSLFWRAHYLAPSKILEVIPFLFWLVENARPSVSLTLGLRDPVPYFALCQAMDKLGLDSLSLGAEYPSEESSDLRETKIYNTKHYSDFSQIIQADVAEICSFFEESRIDFLIVNQHTSLDMQKEINTNWLPRMSEKGIILFLRGGDTLPTYVENLPQNAGWFTFDASKGIHMLLCGDQSNERLTRLCQLKIGQPGYMAARNVFQRMGELHRKSVDIETVTLENRATKHKFEQQRGEVKKFEQKVSEKDEQSKKLLQQLKGKATQIASVQSEMFDLRASFTNAKATADQKLKTVTQERDDARAKLAQFEATLEQERSKQNEAIKTVTQEREDARAKLAQFEATLEQERSKQNEAIKTVTQEREDARAKLAQFEANLVNRLSEINNLSSALTTANQERDAYLVKITALETDLKKEQFKYAAAQDAATKSDNQVIDLEQQNAQHITDIAILGVEIDNLEERNKTLNAQRQSEIADLGNLLQAREQLSNSLTDTLKTTQAHQNVLNKLKHPHNNLNRALSNRLAVRSYKAARTKLYSDTDLIAASNLFDAEWYKLIYPDIADQDPLRHFVQNGLYELRNPSPHFDSLKYHLANPDVTENGTPALLHYIQFGKAEGRTAYPVE